MKLIASENLKKGVTYYIEKKEPLPGSSGKKIGVFSKITNFPGLDTIYVEFINIRNFPNAKRPSGLGETPTNVFKSQDHNFYLPENQDIMLRKVINDRTNSTSGEAALGFLGGKKKSRKSRKSRKSKKSRKSRRQ